MALTANQIRNNALDPAFVDETAAVQLVLTARTVLDESGATPNHAERVAYAKTVLRQPQSEARTWIWFLLSDSTLTSANAANIATAATNGWNVMAGV